MDVMTLLNCRKSVYGKATDMNYNNCNRRYQPSESIFEDEDDNLSQVTITTSGDSRIQVRRNSVQPASVDLEIYQAGELTVLGFGGREILDQLNFAESYDDMMRLVRDYHCSTLALDLTGVRLIPSGLLGILMSVYQQKVDVLLFNASEDIREVIAITKLDRYLQLHDVEL